jgi:hypothetical protein
MCSDAQAVMVSRAFQFFDISRELLLQEVETMADVPPKFLGKSAELLAGLFRDEQSIGHRLVYDFQVRETIGSLLSS